MLPLLLVGDRVAKRDTWMFVANHLHTNHLNLLDEDIYVSTGGFQS